MVAVALVYVQFVTPTYTVTSRLLLQRNAQRFIRDGQVEQQQPDNNNFLFTQQQVVTSTPVLATALSIPGVHDIRALHGRSDALAILKKQLDVEVGKKDELLSISFDAADPAEGTLLVNAVVDSYARFQVGLRRSNSSEMANVLRDEKKARDSELSDRTQDLLSFQAAHGLSGETDQANVTEKRLQGLSDALTQARLETVAAESAYDEVRRGLQDDPKRAAKVTEFLKSSGSVLPSSSDDSIIRQEMLSLKSREIELRQRFMPNHPSILAIEKRIDELDIAFAAGVQHRYDAAVQHEVDLQRSFDQQQKVAFEMAGQQAEYDRRKAEVSRLQKLVETLDNRIKEVALTEDGGVPSVTVLEPARASDKPTHPDKARALFIAAFLGLCLSSAFAVVAEARARAMGGALDVQIDFGMPVLGQMPLLFEEITSVSHDRPMLIDTGDSIGALKRALLGVLQQNPPTGRGATILVTSPSRGDGKSTLVSNLAMNLAADRKRVLLVDADFRAPSMGRIFGLGGGTGLGTLLDTDEPLPVTAIHHTGNPFLDVILSGPTQRGASEMLNSQRFMDLLGDLADRYEYVLLDSPPAVNYGDARTVAASCDMTLLIVRAGRVNRQAFDRAREGLANVGANVAGVILNTGSDALAAPMFEPADDAMQSESRLARTLRRLGTGPHHDMNKNKVSPNTAA